MPRPPGCSHKQNKSDLPKLKYEQITEEWEVSIPLTRDNSGTASLPHSPTREAIVLIARLFF